MRQILIAVAVVVALLGLTREASAARVSTMVVKVTVKAGKVTGTAVVRGAPFAWRGVKWLAAHA